MDGIGEFSRLHCSAEWHLERLDYPRLATAIYSIAFRISKNTGRFSVSYPNLAEYFDADERHVARAVRQLRQIEFFEWLAADPGHSCVYRPVPHSEWSRSHPGKCTEKIALPWDWEGDPLGRQLFAICDGRIKFFYPNVLKGMRNTGLSDAEIVECMKEFRRDGDGSWKAGLTAAEIAERMRDAGECTAGWTRGFVGQFMKYLRAYAEENKVGK